MNSVYKIERAYLFGEPSHLLMLEHIQREDSEWVDEFANDLDTSPQRKQVVLDCILYKWKTLTLVNK